MPEPSWRSKEHWASASPPSRARTTITINSTSGDGNRHGPRVSHRSYASPPSDFSFVNHTRTHHPFCCSLSSSLFCAMLLKWTEFLRCAVAWLGLVWFGPARLQKPSLWSPMMGGSSWCVLDSLYHFLLNPIASGRIELCMRPWNKCPPLSHMLDSCRFFILPWGLGCCVLRMFQRVKYGAANRSMLHEVRDLWGFVIYLIMQGVLRGFDQATNLILDESHERVYSTKVLM